MAVVVSVRHEYADGWHSFTSRDVPGLWLAGPDEQFADLYQSVGPAISALNDARGKAPVRVHPELPAGDAKALTTLRMQAVARFVVEDA